MSQIREAVFLILFRTDFYESGELADQVKDFFDEEDLFKTKEKRQIADKVMAVAARKDEIDAALKEVSVGWKPQRMNLVDLTILRLAYYEIVFDPRVPDSAAINEAVELAKKYGTESSGSFVNGILAKVAGSAKQE